MTEFTATSAGDPHQNQPLVTAGAPVEGAEAAVVLVHGRGATAQGIVQLADQFYEHGITYIAPQAQRSSWYPYSFLAPTERNEPGLSSGLQAIDDAVEKALDAGIPLEKVLLFGFSQGACLTSEYVARTPRRYGGVAIMSGGLIGSEVDPDRYEGSLRGTPVFIGCSDDDPHIPLERVHLTGDVFERLDGDVTTRIYQGMGHGVTEDEIDRVSQMVHDLLDDPAGE